MPRVQVQQYQGAHVNTRHALRCDLDASLRYLAVPSEDGAVALYDVRLGGTVLATMRAHRDVTEDRAP